MSSSRFNISSTALAGLKVIQRTQVEDQRGFFSRFYCAEEMRLAGWNKPIAQINHTLTRSEGAVRGLHFQYPPHAETKIVSCIKGEVFDVAVDLRRGSQTFLRWHGEILSALNCKSLLIPEGFAHGFQALGEDCELIYLHTAAYCPEAEGAINFADPRVAIQWPIAVTQLSARDKEYSFLEQEFDGIAI